MLSTIDRLSNMFVLLFKAILRFPLQGTHLYNEHLSRFTYKKLFKYSMCFLADTHSTIYNEEIFNDKTFGQYDKIKDKI